MAKRKKNGQMSDQELELRRFHKDVRNAKKVCEEAGVSLMTYDDALNDDICILSLDEYFIGTTKSYVDENIESYFVHESDFSETQTLLDHA